MAVESTANTILALERAALDRWGHGDPDGALELATPDISYIDPILERTLRTGRSFKRSTIGFVARSESS